MSPGTAARRGRGERGSVSLLVVIMVPALLMAAGLVLDGGRQLQVRREATAAAATAARAGTQVTEQEIYGRAIDPELATSRASAALRAAGMSGSVVVSGNRVTVTVTANVDYLILPGSPRRCILVERDAADRGHGGSPTVSERVFERANHSARSFAHGRVLGGRLLGVTADGEVPNMSERLSEGASLRASEAIKRVERANNSARSFAHWCPAKSEDVVTSHDDRVHQ